MTKARNLLNRAALSLPAMALASSPALAERKTEIHPYLAVDQSVVADLSGGNGRTENFTSVSVGVDAHVQGHNSEVQANIAYQHQFSWTKGVPDQDVVTGIVSARTDVIRNALSIEAGALATRVRTDGFTGANGNLLSAGSRSQVYSAYVGPTYRSHIGELEVNAAYRLGYNRLEDGADAALTGTPQVDSFDQSWNHYATASIGEQPGGTLPFGWAVGAGYEREDASQLDQRFEDAWGRVDLTYPVTPELAVVGGVGYEKIKISNRDALRDTTGTPIRDGGGRFITNTASPRLLAYDTSEVIWDAGILWKPSRRTSAQVTVGHRYGSMSYSGSITWQPDRRSSVNISLYDSVDSFGRSLTGDLANVPTNFSVSRNPFSSDIGGCAFGETAGGVCFNDSLSGIRTANFRNRGVSASYSRQAGPWSLGVGAGYSRRKLIANDTVFPGINGSTDEYIFASAVVSYAIDEVSGIDANVYANQFNSGFAGVADVFNAGAYLTYHRTFMRKLQATASVGIDEAQRSGVDSVLTGLAQLGIRYQF
jgi:predicted porin